MSIVLLYQLDYMPNFLDKKEKRNCGALSQKVKKACYTILFT